MRLMDKPFSTIEKENEIRMLDGCVCRICVSDDELEISRMVGFACAYISMLAQSRLLQLKEKRP